MRYSSRPDFSTLTGRCPPLATGVDCPEYDDQKARDNRDDKGGHHTPPDATPGLESDRPTQRAEVLYAPEGDAALIIDVEARYD
jgi:hypothetical protein